MTGPLTFAEFFEAEFPSVVRALDVLVGNPAAAEELAEESFARAYERWDRVASMQSPAGFVYRTAVNLFRNDLRRARLRRAHGERSGHAEVTDHAGEVNTRTDVRRAVAGLPRAQREVLLLVEWLGYDAESAGAVLGIRAGAVRARLHRARESLREHLG